MAEVQIDRFLFRLWSGYPDRDAETRILEEADALEDPHVDPVTSPEALLALRELVKEVHVSEMVVSYIVDLVERLRGDSDVLLGPSPRGSLALYRGSRALALLEGRDFALPDDVRQLALPALEHRIRPTAESELDEITSRALVERALEDVPVPKGATVS